MKTRFIGMKQLRQNMAKISRQAEKKQERIVVLRKNNPVFELRPLSGEDALLESLRRDIEEAKRDVRTGRIYSQKTVEKRLGL